jgi:16S rRNA processing protein RimM
MSRTESATKKLTLARVGKIHGIKGWLRLNSYTEPADNVLQYQEFLVQQDGAWRTLQLDQSRWQADKLIVHFQGYDSPEAARELTGLDLQIEAGQLPALAEGDYYWHQLQGLSVQNLDNEILGSVKTMMATGANDVLVVSPTGQSLDTRERLIPWLYGTVVREVDLAGQTLIVDWPADYLA